MAAVWGLLKDGGACGLGAASAPLHPPGALPLGNEAPPEWAWRRASALALWCKLAKGAGSPAPARWGKMCAWFIGPGGWPALRALRAPSGALPAAPPLAALLDNIS